MGCVLKAAEKLQFWRGFEPAISKRCKKNHYKWQKKFLECLGFDLGTPGMQNQSSTTALQGQHINNAHFLQPYWANLSMTFLACKNVPGFKKFKILWFLWIPSLKFNFFCIYKVLTSYRSTPHSQKSPKIKLDFKCPYEQCVLSCGWFKIQSVIFGHTRFSDQTWKGLGGLSEQKTIYYKIT